MTRPTVSVAVHYSTGTPVSTHLLNVPDLDRDRPAAAVVNIGPDVSVFVTTAAAATAIADAFAEAARLLSPDVTP